MSSERLRVSYQPARFTRIAEQPSLYARCEGTGPDQILRLKTRNHTRPSHLAALFRSAARRRFAERRLVLREDS